MIASSADIGEAVKFFFDHFAESPGFMELGYPKELPDNVKNAVKQAIAKGLGHAPISIEWSTIEIPDWQIMHGSMVVDGKAGAVVWASDIQTGIASIPKKMGGSELLSMRLSFTPASLKRQLH